VNVASAVIRRPRLRSEHERHHVAVGGPELRAADVRRADGRLDEADRHAGDERAPRLEPHDRRREQTVEPVPRSRIDVERRRRRSQDRREARPGAGQGERDPDQSRHGQPDHAGGVEVLGDRLERAAEARVRQQPGAGGGEHECDSGDEQRALLDRRPADPPDPERQGIGEDVRRTVEEDDEQRPDRECDRE
jgi:hypothetical protein